MALRISKGLRNFILEGGSLKQAFGGGKLLLYTGAQPADADAAVTGTLLNTYTDNGGAHTVEVKATGVVTLGQTGAGTGTVDTFTVSSLEIMGGAVASGATVTDTAAAVVAKINNNPKNMKFVATNVAGVVTVTAKPGLGTLHNSAALTCGVTAGSNTVTSSITSTTFGSGTGGSVAGVNQVNGLLFGDAAAGTLVKDPAQTWSGTAGATGTAGWFRLVGSVVDAGSLDSAEAFLRLDGNVATSGANLNLSSTTITATALQRITTFSPTEPAS